MPLQRTFSPMVSANMGPSVVLVLLLTISTTFGKYVYVSKSAAWYDAQRECQNSYTDMAPVSGPYDMNLLQKLHSLAGLTWFGLVQNTTNDRWMWSGGGVVTKFLWGPNEPNNIPGEDYGGIANYLWVDAPSYFNAEGFFCYKVHAVRERKTWDEALQYCRKYHKDLASVASETEMMLIQKELGTNLSSANVWIGLNFMDSHWMWMDNQPLEYESWGTGGKVTCPDITWACGAVRVSGTSVQVGQEQLVKVSQVKYWNALDCNLRQHFLCY